MTPQNFKNHTRLLLGWHGITAFAILALLIGSIINLFNSAKENLYSASLIVLIAIILIFIFWFTRVFALKAQDRAIRAEENLRYFSLTGKLLDSRLRNGQIIALRFASDAEFVALAIKAVEENLSAKAIKEAIVDWKADFHRV
jgi:predicted branched-subunit amino acid permease